MKDYTIKEMQKYEITLTNENGEYIKCRVNDVGIAPAMDKALRMAEKMYWSLTTYYYISKVEMIFDEIM